MNEWIYVIASICIGVPVSIYWKLPSLIAGMLCMGINILIWIFINK
jgi:hypothetical protein